MGIDKACKTRPMFSIITTELPQVAEHFVELAAPFTDKDGKQLYENDVVISDNGMLSILRYGYYSFVDDIAINGHEATYIQRGCGWYLQTGALREDKKLGYYQHLCVLPGTNMQLTKVCDSNGKPDWWSVWIDYITQVHKLLTAPDKNGKHTPLNEFFAKELSDKPNADMMVPHCHVCGETYEDDAVKRNLLIEKNVCCNCAEHLIYGKEHNHEA